MDARDGAPWDRRAALAQAQTVGIDEIIAEAEPSRIVADVVLSGFALGQLAGARAARQLVFRREGASTLRMAHYLPRRDAIVINLDDRVWNDPSAVMRNLAERRLFPSGLPAFPVLHELGHRAHYLALDDPSRWLAYRGTRLTREEQRIIYHEVGINAGRDPLEFVADVYAVLIEGRSFTEELLRLYERFGGPNL